MGASEESYNRLWLAIGLGTIVLLISYSSLLVAIVATRSDTPDAAGPAFALGFGLVPLVFVVVAFVSGRRNAPGSVLRAMGVWVLVALPLGLVNPVFGLAAGYGVGGVLTLKVRDTDRWQARLAGTFMAAAYSFGMLFLIPPLGLISGGLLPLTSLGLVDYYTQHRAADEAGSR